MVKRSTARRDLHRTTIRRSGAGCWLCGRPIDFDLPHLDPMAFVVDHVIPLARGGSDTIDNARGAHRACNAAKGARLDGGPVLRRSGSLKR